MQTGRSLNLQNLLQSPFLSISFPKLCQLLTHLEAQIYRTVTSDHTRTAMRGSFHELGMPCANVSELHTPFQKQPIKVQSSKVANGGTLFEVYGPLSILGFTSAFMCITLQCKKMAKYMWFGLATYNISIPSSLLHLGFSACRLLLLADISNKYLYIK